jgi:hypothetical protein
MDKSEAIAPHNFVRVDTIRDGNGDISRVDIYFRNGRCIQFDPDSMGLYAYQEMSGMIDTVFREDRTTDQKTECIEVDGKLFSKSYIRAMIGRLQYLEDYFTDYLCTEPKSKFH